MNVWLSDSPKAAMDDVDPERSFTSGSNETLKCTFYSNPGVESVTWYDGPDDQGELILTDQLEPNAEDKYISTLFLENIKSNRTVTCLAIRTRVIRNTANKESFTFYIQITNAGMVLLISQRFMYVLTVPHVKICIRKNTTHI